jgi:HEAT repeat protein
VTSKDVDEQIACLRLLAGCGTKDAVSPIASMLNSSNHHIRVATVNALRGIVDGQRPYANLTVFNAITEVKKWKARLGR